MITWRVTTVCSHHVKYPTVTWRSKQKIKDNKIQRPWQSGPSTYQLWLQYKVCLALLVVDRLHQSAEYHMYNIWVVKAPPMVGPTWTRVRLTLGSNCSPSLFQGTALLCLPLYAFLIDCLHMFNVRWYRVVLVCCLYCSLSVCAPLRAMYLDHLYVHLHGSLYPMMDCMSHTYNGLPSSMSAGAPWDSIRYYY